MKTLNGIRIYQSRYAPTEMDEVDEYGFKTGRRVPVLFTMLDNALILVHPDRWDEFKDRIEALSKTESK